VSARRVVEVPGLGHGGQPIPLASIVRGVLMTGTLSGRRPAGDVPAELAAEFAQLFANVRAVLAAAGAETGDVVRMTFMLGDRAQRELLNAEWLAMFPDPADRPSRHVAVHELPPGLCVQCELTAVLEHP
jgi:2-iminobutanoate/2-iminopropanoate deaminase